MAEYRRWGEEARGRMFAFWIDCLFLTAKKNIRYLTGFRSPTWINPTISPTISFLPLDAEPVAIVPTANLPGFRYELVVQG